MTMRATQHAHRCGSAKHNDRAFDLDKAAHIDQSRVGDNKYFCCYEGLPFEEAERKFYAENFQDMINDINERAERARHPERKTNASQLVTAKKTQPEEVIYQIGNKNQSITGEQLQAAYADYIQWHNQRFGRHVKLLSAALHVDETTPHIHERRVWVYDHERGFKGIGQHKALEQLGYTLPDPTKPRSKHNNLKMVYTAECREKWLECCRRRGIEVESEPLKRAPNEQNLAKGDYIIQSQEEQLRQLQERYNTMKARGNAIHSDLQTKITALRQEHDALQTKIDALKKEFFTLDGQDFTPLFKDDIDIR